MTTRQTTGSERALFVAEAVMITLALGALFYGIAIAAWTTISLGIVLGLLGVFNLYLTITGRQKRLAREREQWRYRILKDEDDR